MTTVWDEGGSSGLLMRGARQGQRVGGLLETPVSDRPEGGAAAPTAKQAQGSHIRTGPAQRHAALSK